MIFECVPNISEGRDATTVDECVRAVEQAGAHVLHRTSDAQHNRSVLSLAGSHRELLAAAVALAGVARDRIDLNAHRGVHPRIGALDVLPFVPLEGAAMSDAVALARASAEAIWQTHGIPSYFYGEAASAPERRNLAAVRANQQLDPDVGTARRHPTAGAIAVGAREILIAFNVELASGDLGLARRIARQLRERDGGLRTLRALGFRLRDDLVQVSLNITDYHAVPLYRVVELIRDLAGQEGVAVARSELIGLIPYAAVEESARYYLGSLP